MSRTAALVLALVPALARAEAPVAPDAEEEGRVYALARVHWDYPLKVSAGSGILLTRLPRDYNCVTTCPMRGFTVKGAVGLGGGEASVGWASMVAETGRSRRLLRHVYVGYGLRAAYVRTWGESNVSPEGDDFVGLQSAWTIAQFNVTFGVFRRVPAADPGQDTHVFAGLGWGF